MGNEMEGMVREKLNIYYLLDVSASMSGSRIQQLNACMQSLKAVLEDEGIDNNVDIIIRAIQFGGDVKWHTGSAAEGVAIENFMWTDLSATGNCTPTSEAIKMLADSITPEYLGKRALRPVAILVTDGACTDSSSEYSAACTRISGKIKGNLTRIAIGVENANKAELEEFASVGQLGENSNTPFVFKAENAEAMTELIHWASLVSISSSLVSKGETGQGLEGGSDPVIPDEPEDSGIWI